MNLLKTLKRLPRGWRPETFQYADRVAANSGSITESSLAAIDKFIVDCVTAGIWSKFIEVGPFAGSNLNAALVKLVYPGGGSSALTNNNFIAADYVETGSSGGLLGDGSTKFLSTGLLGTSLPDTGHVSFYLREDVAAAGNRMLLGAVSGSDHYWLGALTPSAGSDCRYGGVVTASASGTLSKGFYTGVRDSTTSLALYRDASVISTAGSTAATTKPALALYAWAYNSSGSASARLPARGSFYSIGQSLNGAEVLALHNAVRNLQTALNRAVN
jgi:hypothetical protein